MSSLWSAARRDGGALALRDHDRRHACAPRAKLKAPANTPASRAASGSSSEVTSRRGRNPFHCTHTMRTVIVAGTVGSFFFVTVQAGGAALSGLDCCAEQALALSLWAEPCPRIGELGWLRRRALRASGKRRQAAALQRHGLAKLDRAEGLGGVVGRPCPAMGGALECGGLTPLWLPAEREP